MIEHIPSTEQHSPTILSHLLKNCKRLRRSIKWNPFSPYRAVGLCFALQSLCGRQWHTDHLHSLFETWPEWSGDLWYPVPSNQPNVHPSALFYREQGNMWKGEYGKARMRLLEHCISELEKQLKEA